MNKKTVVLIFIISVLLVVVKMAQAENEKRIINPVSPDTRYQSLYNLGISALSNNDYSKALAYFKQALEQDKNSADALMMIGYTQTRLGNPNDAIINLKAVLKSQPNSAKARQYLGEAYIRAAVQEMDILNSYGDKGQDQLQNLGRYFITTYEQLIKCEYCPVKTN
ncbi:MAG: tetratricopeptide repeat protein [bacterium]|nr:tetratricopeptide repeat protein [bacterium]MDD5354302.1 tetratricopeptide repeat protein [bacterium]MDD5756918.1 tetratricopeptide repeat protein [bacterium]